MGVKIAKFPSPCLGTVSKKLPAAVGLVFRLRRCQAQKALDVALPRLRAFRTFRLASEKHARPRDEIFLETAPRVQTVTIHNHPIINPTLL
jgi:hypothetical protein